jgi:hypothetical protein
MTLGCFFRLSEELWAEAKQAVVLDGSMAINRIWEELQVFGFFPFSQESGLQGKQSEPVEPRR